MQKCRSENHTRSSENRCNDIEKKNIDLPSNIQKLKKGNLKNRTKLKLMKNYIENSKEAAYVKAAESYSIIFWANGQKIVKPRPMKYYAASFEAQGWCRIHRSYMVNPIFTTNVTPDREYICLSDGTELPISRRLRKQVLKWRNLKS